MTDTPQALLHLSDNVVRVRRVRNAVGGAHLDAATVKIWLYEGKALSQEVAGQTWPVTLTLNNGASDQNKPEYTGSINRDIDVEEGDSVFLKVEIDAGTGLTRTFRVPLRVEF